MAFRLVLQSPRGARGMVRQYKSARDEALRAVAEYWCKELLPAHFTEAGAAKYRFTPRTEKYNRRKRREGRGEDPNVYTGRLKQKMLGTKPRVSVNKRGLTLVWSGLPRYTFVVDSLAYVKADARWNDETFVRMRAAAGSDPKAQEKVEKSISGILRWRMEHPETADGKFKKVKRPNKVEELTAVNRADADSLMRVFRSVFQAGIQKKAEG